jgi:hypothetical protein
MALAWMRTPILAVEFAGRAVRPAHAGDRTEGRGDATHLVSETPTVTDRSVIRAATKDDFPMWKTLWDGYNAFYGREGQTALPPEVTQTTWTRFLDPSEPMHVIVAEDSG